MQKNTKELESIYGQASEESDFMDKKFPTLPGLRKPYPSHNKIGLGQTTEGINPHGTTVSMPNPKSRFSLPDVSISEPARSGLLKAGLNVLAGSGPSFVPQSTSSIIARGALAGVDEYQKQTANNIERERLNRLFGLEKSKFGLQQQRFKHQIDKEILEKYKLGGNQITKVVNGRLQVGRAGSYPGSQFEIDRPATKYDLPQPKGSSRPTKKTGINKTRADFGNNAAIAARKTLLARGETDEGTLASAGDAAFNAAVLPGLGFTRKTVVTREADAGGILGGSRPAETETRWIKVINGKEYGPPKNLNEVLQELPFEGGTAPAFTEPKAKPTSVPPPKKPNGKLAEARDKADDERGEELRKQRRDIKKGKGAGSGF